MPQERTARSLQSSRGRMDAAASKKRIVFKWLERVWKCWLRFQSDSAVDPKNPSSCRAGPLRISKLRMQTCRDRRYRPAVSVVGRIGDELIIERQLPRVDGHGVVGFQDFLGAGIGEGPVSDQSG
jgi:hypothetical protein